MKKAWILVASVLVAATTSWSQSDLELAEFYYNEGSYAQSKLYLDQIWKMVDELLEAHAGWLPPLS